MAEILDSAVPGLVEQAVELFQGSSFLSSVFDSLKSIDATPGPKLVWSTQQAASTVALSAGAQSEETAVAAQAYRRTQRFAEVLERDNETTYQTLLRVVGLGSSASDDATAALQALVLDSLLDRLSSSQSRQFAFAPLLYHIRSIVDPGRDPNGEQSEKLRAGLGERLKAIEGIESMFLRKELKVGKFEMPVPFWTDAIEITADEP